MRALLFVPGDARPKLDKALGCGADALTFTIERRLGSSLSSRDADLQPALPTAFRAKFGHEVFRARGEDANSKPL